MELGIVRQLGLNDALMRPALVAHTALDALFSRSCLFGLRCCLRAASFAISAHFQCARRSTHLSCLRGGEWNLSSDQNRASRRTGSTPGVGGYNGGFRVVRTP